MTGASSPTDASPARHLVLVGMPGAGKSTVGPRVAQALGRPFADLDDVVAARAGMPVAEMLSTHGESMLRGAEAAALAVVLAGDPLVLATGGGTVLDRTNRHLVTRGSPYTSAPVVVWLDVPVATLVDRVAHDPAVRPLLGNDRSGGLAALDTARRSLYAQVGARVTADGTPEQVTARVLHAFAMATASR